MRDETRERIRALTHARDGLKEAGYLRTAETLEGIAELLRAIEKERPALEEAETRAEDTLLDLAGASSGHFGKLSDSVQRLLEII